MVISKHDDFFAGRRIREFDASVGLVDPVGTAYRLSVDYDESESGVTLSQKLTRLLNDPLARQVEAIVIGCWDSAWEGDGSSVVVAELVANAGKLPNLRALFIGDITYQECEISWIKQTDMSPLWTAYPKLEAFRVRGNNGLALGALRHANLKSLIVETGGLSSSVIENVCSASLPQLEHLELWLGSDNYGWDGSVDVLQPILPGTLFPKLEYLGLRDAQIADDIAAAVATAPISRHLKVLDLSLGNLGDVGAKALLSLPIDARLEKLDLHHHYISTEMMDALTKWFPFEVDLNDAQEGDDDDRYIAVAE